MIIVKYTATVTFLQIKRGVQQQKLTLMCDVCRGFVEHCNVLSYLFGLRTSYCVRTVLLDTLRTQAGEE